MSDAKVERAIEVLKKLSEPDYIAYHANLKAKLAGYANLTPSTLARLFKGDIPENSKKKYLVADWVTSGMIVAELRERRCNPAAIAEIEKLTQKELAEYPSGKVSQHSEATSDSRLHQAIEDLFGLEDVFAPKSAAREYFGYRLSATRGEIVRFYIKLEYDPGTRLLSFRNHYRRWPDFWTVTGTGFSVDQILYLFGQARADQGASQTLGLRNFTLVKFRLFDWYTGHLSSLTKQEPLTARIVLIPAEQHKTFAQSHDKAATIKEMIEKSVPPDSLNEEIITTDPSVLGSVPMTMLIHSLVWNASFTVLRGSRTPIPMQTDLTGYSRLLEMRKRLLAKRPGRDNDIYYFLLLMRSDEVFDAILSFLDNLPPDAA